VANSLIAALANNPITNGVLSMLERVEIGADQRLRVITYHRVADLAKEPGLYPRITIHPDLFEQHMRFLNQYYHVVGMDEVLQAVRALHPDSARRTTRINHEPREMSWHAEDTPPSAEVKRDRAQWLIPETSGSQTAQARPTQPPSARAGARTTPKPDGSAKKLPSRAVLITFDDATTDFAENALPVLQRYHLPATMFVPTGFPASPQRVFWWDKLYTAIEHSYNLNIIQTPLGGFLVETPAQRSHAFSMLRDYVKSLPHPVALDWVDRFCAELETPFMRGSVLSWDALRAVRAAGITLGAHTRNHPIMERISPDEARAEAVGSWQDLRRETGDTLPVFAFPSGDFNPLLVEILREEGFELAFTTQRGVNRLAKTDPLQLKRINAGPRTSLNVLRAQLLAF
jgi:peptidoglycan/xylan/chitin deacetylase (PgdA/CDA1 family)